MKWFMMIRMLESYKMIADEIQAIIEASSGNKSNAEYKHLTNTMYNDFIRIRIMCKLATQAASEKADKTIPEYVTEPLALSEEDKTMIADREKTAIEAVADALIAETVKPS